MAPFVRLLLAGLGLAMSAWPSLAAASEKAESSDAEASTPARCRGDEGWRFTPVSLSLGPKRTWPRPCHPFGGFLALALPHAEFRSHDGVMVGGYAHNTVYGVGLQVAAVAHVEDYFGLQIGLATLSGPPIGSDEGGLIGIAGAQLGAVVARADELLGAQLAGISARSELLVGVQVGGLRARSEWAYGMLAGGVVARTETMHGVELGGVVARTDELLGVQLGGVLAQAWYLRGLQASAGIAVSVDFDGHGWPGMKGVQVGGLATYSGTHVGAQLTGIFARADQLDGVQIAGLANAAWTVTGAQLAPINVTLGHHDGLQLGGLHNYAGAMNGVQVGFINVTGRLRGVQLGLLNFALQGGAKFMPLLNVGVDRSGRG